MYYFWSQSTFSAKSRLRLKLKHAACFDTVLRLIFHCFLLVFIEILIGQNLNQSETTILVTFLIQLLMLIPKSYFVKFFIE